MTRQSQVVAAILLISIPGVQFGGYSLLRLVTRREHGWEDNPLRRSLWRAGHAHAGVWVVVALVVLLYVDQVVSGTAATIARWSVALAPIFGPLGFFLSVTTPDARRPNGVINLVFLAAVLQAVGVVIVGVGLLTK